MKTQGSGVVEFTPTTVEEAKAVLETAHKLSPEEEIAKQKADDEKYLIPKTKNETSPEEVTRELEKLGASMETLKKNDHKFSKEILTKEKEPAVNSLREKLGNSMGKMLDGLAKIDKEKVMMASVVAGLITAMIPVMGISDLQTVMSVLPDSISHLLRSPELAGSPVWSIISPGGDSFSMPSMENYMHQVDVFSGTTDISSVTEGNPFASPSDVVDPNVIAQKLKMGINEQNMYRMGSAFGNLASSFVIVPSVMMAGKAFGKIGKYFTNKK